jgi:signal transduction histidine kinase
VKRRAKAGRAKTKRRNIRASVRGKASKAPRRKSASADGAAGIVRLRQELKQAHEREAAATEVLRVIGSSPGGLEPVFKHMLDSAVRLCEAKFGNIYLVERGAARLVATLNTPPSFVEFRKHTPPSTDPKTPSGRMLATKAVVHIPDLAAEESYRQRHPGVVAAVELLGERTSLHVPMLKEGELIGYLSIYRQEVRPFTDAQIALVETFAAQAVIAVENARLLDEIQDKSRQLAEASRHKSQFLANMSHELRTPLNAILAYTELIADGVYGELPDKMRDVLKRVEANGTHLLGLINEVLDISKIEAGQFKLELGDYLLGDIAESVRSTLEPLAAEKALAFRVEVAPDLPAGHGDKRRLTQVLINLAGNAIKFTDAGEVVITAGMANGAFHVAVRDTGPGISGAEQVKLFQEFQRTESAVSRAKGGTGLGLALSKRIVEMHGGRIWIDSVLGQGSTFAFTLPVWAEHDETG